jgi:hypothetical protein
MPVVDRTLNDHARLLRSGCGGGRRNAPAHLPITPCISKSGAPRVERRVAAPAAIEGATDVTAIAVELAGDVQSERVAWSTLRAQFECNLALFDERTRLGADVLREWRTVASSVQLLRLADGRFRLASAAADVRRRLPAGAEAPSDVAALRAAWRGRIIRTLAIHGVGLGGVPLAVVAASEHTFLDFSPQVLLIESSLLAWGVVLHLRDWRGVLDLPRVQLCAGHSAMAQLDALLADVDRLPPVLIAAGPAWPDSPAVAEVAARLRAAEQARATRQALTFQRVSSASANVGRDVRLAQFDGAVRGERRLSILGITSRYTTVLQYTMRDLLTAFAAAGHATQIVMEVDAHAHFSPLRTLEAIASSRPDLIVLIDHAQREFRGILPESIPVVTWIQDQLPHLFTAEAGAAVGPLEFVFGHGFPELLTRFGYPPERFLPCAIPTNAASLCAPQETAEDLTPFRCDVMFAGNATATTRELFERLRTRVPEALRPLLDAAYEELMVLLKSAWFCGDYHYAALLARCEQSTGRLVTDPALRAAAVNMLRGVADQALRERVVGWAAEWAQATGGRLHLYGRGWETRPALARFARGFVPHGPLLGRAFRGAKVSLHAGVNPALHQRVIDGLCAGGFFLVAEKPFDTSAAVSRAILEHYERARPALPFRMTCEALAEPARSAYARSMWLRGADPAVGDLNTADELLTLRLHCRHGLAHTASSVWPRFSEVVFHGREQFFERLTAWVADDDGRCALAQEMRSAVMAHFTYDALARRLLQFVRDGVAGRTRSLIGADSANTETPRRRAGIE